MSLLLSQGHPAAPHYPLAYMWNEVGFARRRAYATMRLTAMLNMVATQGTGDAFKRIMEDMDDG